MDPSNEPATNAPGLPATTADGRARLAALRDLPRGSAHSTSLVNYHSAGQVLIIGPSDRTMPLVAALGTGVTCTLLSPTDTDISPVGVPAAAPGAPRLLNGRIARVSGHLGQFTVTASAGADREVDLATLTRGEGAHFDIVLDLTSPPHIERDLVPPGYFAPGADSTALRRAVAEIPDLVGEFQKPRYFDYNPGICAHGRSGLRGCTRCLDACPAQAITSLGEQIEVDPYLCQGGGSCATACPTGAITYAYPSAGDLLTVLRASLQRYRQAGGSAPWVLFHDAEAGARAFDRIAAEAPECVLPFQIEEIGAVGMDTWLSVLAYGGQRVILSAGSATPASIMRELRAQLDYAHAVLEGMGLAAERIVLLDEANDAQVIARLGALAAAAPDAGAIEPASFASLDDKRRTIHMAVDHLHAHAPAPRPSVNLPAGAPFGEVWVDRNRCTLCMACASVCPASALMAGDDKPQLSFLEENCVQCGLCARSCPENAIGPAPRYLYDAGHRLKARVMYEEEPFCCIVCGKPFATQKIVQRMTQKLSGHWMFQGEDALRRLKMCEDCRVKDMFVKETGLDAGSRS